MMRLVYCSFLCLVLICSDLVAQTPGNPNAAQTPTKVSNPNPTITAVTQFQQQGSQAASKEVTYLVEVDGDGLSPANDAPTALAFPAPDSEPSLVSVKDKQVFVQLQAKADYSVQHIALLYKSGPVLSPDTPAVSCSEGKDIISRFEFVPQGQAKNKYGNGVAKNFHVVQLSIVNRCSLGVTIPLASITVERDSSAVNTVPSKDEICSNAIETQENDVDDESREGISPYSLDHVTSVYTTDRQLTGLRAVFFNSLQAAATLGSAIEPFFGRGFTQGVSILGGGFTTAASDVFKDMSAAQLQNIATQSFGTSEQLAPNGGAVQKFLFLPKKAENQRLECALKYHQVRIRFIAIPTTSTIAVAAQPSGR